VSEQAAMSSEEFQAFYGEHLPSVYGYVLRLCAGDKALAEDLTQDVWLRLVDELRRGHHQRADIRWLITVARSRFIDDARRQRLGVRKLALVRRVEDESIRDLVRAACPHRGPSIARVTSWATDLMYHHQAGSDSTG
jgi:RNA polymerase sigma factor (sigma-70 family)